MSPRLCAGEALPPEEIKRIRRDACLRGFKWDPQVGDTCTLSSFPLVLDRDEWSDLARLAEALAAEATAAESELLARPDLWRLLGVPRAIRKALAGAPCASAPRIMRFDFHPTRDGWRLSEVNADVPGGFFEATAFSEMMAARHAGLALAGRPADAWADALARAAGGGRTALLSAPGFMEDAQVVAYLASLLRERGVDATLVDPSRVRWLDGVASVGAERLALIVRFFQAEWLPGLARGVDWKPYFGGAQTPVANAGSAALLESKRFPLAWDALETRLPTWRGLLPETREPRDADVNGGGWLLKGAYGNNGDDVLVPEMLQPAARRRLRWRMLVDPRGWIAQRRFDVTPVASPDGDLHACVGVYAIDGRACGAYARVTREAIIDHRAIDAPLLIAATRRAA